MAKRGKESEDIQVRYRKYEECESEYLRGREINDIAKRHGVEEWRVHEWEGRFSWREKRVHFLGSVQGASAMVREMMGRKVASGYAVGELSMELVEEMGKLGKALSQLDSEGVGTAGVMAVIRDLSVWVRGAAKSAEEYNLVSLYLQRYLQEVALK